MSTKTLKQRIALVAVSAMGFGLLSIMPANAAAGDAVTTGDVTLTDTSGITVGLCLTQTEAATKVSTTPRVFQTGGTQRITTATNGTGVFNITGPAVFFATGNAGNTISADQKTLTSAQLTTSDIRFTGTGTVSVAIRATAGGTPVHTYYFSVVASCAVDTFSAVDSPVAVTTSATATQITTSVDASTSGITAGNPLFIQVIGKNAYGAALTTGTYVATATNGATVAWGNAAAATSAGTLSVATVTPDGTDQLRIDPASSLATSTSTVTITHNGLPVTTKTLTFYGEVKKIVIESVKSGRTSTAIANTNEATAYAIYSYRDSADGKVPGGAATFAALSATSIVTTGTSVKSPSRSTASSNIADNALADAQETLIGRIQDGVFAFTCGSTSATTTVSIAHVNAISLATITAPVTIACNGSLATYTVSTDKASYAVGEIATITIDAKDSSGNPVSDNTVIAANSVSVGGGSLTATIAGTEVFTAGKRTMQAQMTTAGKFNTVVTLAGSVTSTATTGYQVTDGAVSNAQVLQSIVALIASINKQIQALQKLILARR